MNSPTTTGATAITSAMLAGVIIWLCGVLRISAPPVEVAGTIGAGLLYGAHLLANFIASRMPAKTAPTPVTAPTAVPTPAAPTP